jgi:mercuric ion transport protein
MKNESKLIGAGLLTAISASLCCITPVLAIIAGTSGVASTFSWIEPFRPFLIGLTVLVLGFAWYQKLKPQKVQCGDATDCKCDINDKPKFMESKSFLGITTAFAVLMLTFPSFSKAFFQTPTTSSEYKVAASNIKTVEFKISGMTCESCEQHVNHEVNKLDGILKSKTSYQNQNSIIEFDESKTNQTAIAEALALTGYQVSQKQ